MRTAYSEIPKVRHERPSSSNPPAFARRLDPQPCSGRPERLENMVTRFV